MDNDIIEVLKSMDALDDDQWTGDGAPKVDYVNDQLEGDAKITRQDIVNAAPEFSRGNMNMFEEETEWAPAEEQDEQEGGDPASTEVVEEYLEGEPLVEQDFIPLLMRVDVDSLAILEHVLVEQLQEAEAAMSRAEELKNRVKRSLAYTRNRIKSEVPDMSNQQAIQQFIKSQTEQRGARVEKTRELLAGVDLKSLDPRAAIDRAMARKTGRGVTRPTRTM